MMKILKEIKNNRLNLYTALITILFTILYIIALIYLLANNYRKSFVMSVSADYVTVVSCVIIVIQLIAFVKDSRRNEFRSRKEAAYRIAKEYANGVLIKMSFIQRVLSNTYDKKDPLLLEKNLKQVQITGFTNNDMQKNEKYKKYIELFLSGKNDAIPLNIIYNNSVICKIDGFTDIENHVASDMKLIVANTRFKIMIFDTLNTLEYFAMSINQNVSDSEMLYPSLHQTIVRFVAFVYPFICCQNIESELFYPNIIDLYKSWYGQQKDEELRQQKIKKKQQDILKKESKKAKPL